MRLLLAACVLPLLGSFDTVEFAFDPVEGTAIALKFEVRADTETIGETWCPIYNGERVSEEGGSFDGGGTSSLVIGGTFIDRYVRVEEGRVTRLVRSFVGVEGELAGSQETDDGAEEYESELGTPLDGRAVAFEWDAEEESYTASFADHVESDDLDVDALLLADLEADAFGAWFLPAVPVEPGDEWEVSVDAWSDFVGFGGETWIDEVEDPMEVTEATAELLRDQVEDARENAEGTVACLFEGLEEVDGTALAVIRIEVELETRSVTETTEEVDGESFDVTTTIEDATEAEGRCLWNIEEGRPHRIEFEVEVRDTTLTLESTESEGDTYSMEWTTTSETAARIVLAYEPR